MLKLPPQFANKFFGNWKKSLTSSLIIINFILVVIFILLIVIPRSETLYRVDAVTDAFNFRANEDLFWGQTEIRFREGEAAPCKRAKLVVPSGSAVEAHRSEAGTSVTAAAPEKGAKITIKCVGGEDVSADSATIVFPRADLEVKHVVDFSGLARALTPRPPVTAAARISGTALRIGGTPDDDSPMSSIEMIRSGSLITESSSWPRSTSVTSERPLAPGEIVSFENQSERGQSIPTPRAFTGLLLVTDDGLRIIARTKSTAAYITNVDAPTAKPAVVAPSLLAQLQAQPEWGVFLLIGSLLLWIVTAFRGLLEEAEERIMLAPPTEVLRQPDEPSLSKNETLSRAILPAIMIGALSTFLNWSGAASAQPISDHPVFRIEGPSGVGQGFAIQNPAGFPKCLLVTSDHVVKRGDSVTLIGQQPNSTSIKLAPMRVSAQYLDELAPGLIVLEPSKGGDLGNCGPLQPSQRMDELYETDAGGRITYVDNSGESQTIRFYIEGNPRSSDRLKIKVISQTMVEPSISGGPLSVNGRLLAVAEEVIGGVAYITRIDTARLNDRYIATLSVPKVLRQPFDLTGFPEKYRDVALRAREIATQASRIQQLSQETARSASDAAMRADNALPGYGAGHISNKDRVYAGQVNAEGVIDGLGVLKIISGDFVGDQYAGRFKSEKNPDGTWKSQLTGPAVQEFFNPKINNDRKKMEGTFSGHSFDGYGVITYADGSILWSYWKDGVANIGTFQRYSDKSGWENTWKDNLMNGPGIRWTREGQVLCICEWKNGVVIRDDTEHIMSSSK